MTQELKKIGFCGLSLENRKYELPIRLIIVALLVTADLGLTIIALGHKTKELNIIHNIFMKKFGSYWIIPSWIFEFSLFAGDTIMLFILKQKHKIENLKIGRYRFNTLDLVYYALLFFVVNNSIVDMVAYIW